MADPPEHPFAGHHLRLLIEQIPAIVWTADVEYRFTSVIGAGLESVGVHPGVEDLDVSTVLGTGDTAVASLAAHRRALAGNRSSYAASWKSRIYECCVEPLQADGEIVGSIGVAVDVTERRRAERDALSAYEEAVQSIVRAIELRDIVTGEHVERMSDYCTLIAEGLGLEPETRHAIALAARLHDLGKIAVPDGILLKNGALTSEERQIMQRHCAAGHGILGSSQSKILKLAATIALTHHEWWDGSGYPEGLTGEGIHARRAYRRDRRCVRRTHQRPPVPQRALVRGRSGGHARRARNPLRPDAAGRVPQLGRAAEASWALLTSEDEAQSSRAAWCTVSKTGRRPGEASRRQATKIVGI